MGIQDRKKEHVEITTQKDVGYDRPTGLNKYELRHNALPETKLSEVSTDHSLFGRSFSFPLFISSMTGGYVEAGKVNAIIASFCEEVNLPFGVGSQRVLLEEESTAETFDIVRKEAPNAFIAANIGGCQLIDQLSDEQVSLLINSIRADALIVHLNPLQELLQPEGDRNFKGILRGIQHLTNQTKLPVIVKETGAGIGGVAAEKLIDAGVSAIDVAGAGGTSWAKVENRRKSQQNPRYNFDNWGIPTDMCLKEIQQLPDRNRIEMIGSGGIHNSFDIAKALCLGADFAAMASPVIKAISEGGREELSKLFDQLKSDLKMILALTGSNSVDDLNRTNLYEI